MISISLDILPVTRFTRFGDEVSDRDCCILDFR